MNGLEVLLELKKVKIHPKVLMLSSLTSKDAEMTHEAIRLGADDFMLKPKDLPHIREISEELISKVKHLVTLTRSEIHHKPVPVSRVRTRTGSCLSGLQQGVPSRSILCYPCFRQTFLPVLS